MANDSNCNFDTTLSLDKAVLVGRGLVNALGSQELVLRYNGIASVVREDCIEYLEANRKTLDDPKFSFKTYEGTWNCVSITYNEKQSVIEQTFKIDSNIGNLGLITDPVTDPSAQFGDVSRISDGVTIEKAYYWRVVDPTIIELPATPIEGQIWTKTANDNGDGTYDVIVSREIAEDLNATNSSRQGSERGDQETTVDDSIYISSAENAAANQEYAFTSGTIGETDALWTGVTDSTWVIKYTSSEWRITKADNSIIEANHPYTNINSSEWYDGGSSTVTYRADLIVQIGKNPSLSNESIDISTNDVELAFVKDGGTIADPIIGQVKSISNSPLENGKFKTTVSTTTVNMQRIPALDDSIVFSSNGNTDRNAIIVAKNATYEQFQADVNELQDRKLSLSNTVSVDINAFGLYDYTIRSIEV